LSQRLQSLKIRTASEKGQAAFGKGEGGLEWGHGGTFVQFNHTVWGE